MFINLKVIGRTTYVQEETKLIEAPPPQQVETFERREIVIPPPQPAPVEIVRQVIRTEEVQPVPAPLPPPPMQMPPPPMNAPPPMIVTAMPPPPPSTIYSESVSKHEHRESHSERRKGRSKSKRRSKSRRASSVGSSSSEETIVARRIEEREESDPVHGPLTMFMGSRSRDERSIKKRR